jgi:peptide/nickel transport system substrate-binding protein
MIPLGSGPYEWGGVHEDIVTIESNRMYRQGVSDPEIVRWTHVPEAETLLQLIKEDIDIGLFSGDHIEDIRSLGLSYQSVGAAGYGFLGINTENVSIDVRRGIFSLMNRELTLQYFGEGMTQLIHRPMSPTLAEFPVDSSDMFPYDPEKALEYFLEAGYVQDENGMLVDELGNQLSLSIYVVAGGIGNHPAYNMLIQAEEDMKALGGELVVIDAEVHELNTARITGFADAWIMAWGNVDSSDKTNQFATGGSQNYHRFSDTAMDRLLEEIQNTLDIAERRELVSQMLDLAMEHAIELPLYQSINIIVYNDEKIEDAIVYWQRLLTL